ncbi:ABC-F family ATP-binding cassette domain-containing protein [Sulfuriroseicoccus oceanibius]|uniref:ABC-F family ATP-binding cassette domain-containing protein n=1 Tax=Sulfuriroseicoccus oceanibius TaxID=2707525 RepID=A0A6B3LF71_9BACT|nr:ABC-F family ATP-binding cassette domain-containing protein [Sulfuriroseicoccus oceanibius]QQL45145.1 ABC-F family ATP-binding cassette domain-containing protein [Sulfuriroseicoccus oceanibius]
MLAVQHVRIEYGSRVLFADLSFVIQGKERVALVGPNGAGKSTLMKILVGRVTPDGGKIVKAKAVRVGYLAQEGIETSGLTLMQEAESAFGDILGVEKRLEELGAELEVLDPKSDDYAETLDRMGDLQLQLEEHDVSRIRPRIETILRGLGFKQGDFDRMTDEFSGGWQMRIALAKLLLQEPEVLMLDEPTNHLDIEAQRWLEGYLKSYRGAILLISHDRAFLDALCKRTLAFGNGRVEEYSGNYSFYEKESVLRREQLEKAAANQQREIEKTEDFINRFRAKATKAKQVQSRIKMLEKIERIELDQDGPEVRFKFPDAPPSGQAVVKLEDVSKHYGEKRIINNWDFTVEKGDRIAVVGVNGAGKSTFSRIVAEKEPLTGGKMTFGHNVMLNHFAQDQAEELDPKLTALETLESVDTRGSKIDARSILGCFLFRGDDVFKSVSVLSGGERGRLALAKMLLTPSNFLILDEPTNHLDMASQARLQSALLDYQGTFAIVSHNRDFLDPIVNKVLEFRVGAPPRLFLGNVSDYIAKREAEEKEAARVEALHASASAGAAAASGGGASGVNRKEQRRIEAEKRKLRASKLKPLEDQLEKVEARISELETTKAEMVEKMNDLSTFESKEEAQLFLQSFKDVDAELEGAYSQWSDISEEIEKVTAELEA